jgi:anti-sigma-K factor RskA
VEELAGAAALRALTADEARFVALHLDSCARCRALYSELASVAELLVRVPEPITPPPALRARLLAEVARTAQDPAPTSPAAAPTIVALPRRRAGWREWGLMGSLAAALVLGFATFRLQGELAQQSARLAQQEAFARAAASGRVATISGTPAAAGVRGAVADGPGGSVVYLEGMPTPSANRAYQVWLIPAGGQPIGAGVSTPGGGGAQTIPLSRPAAGMQQIAITEEPAGGSPGPTTAILAAGRL